MKIRKKRIWLIIVLVVVFISGLMVLRSFILKKVKVAVEEQFHKLKQSGYTVAYDSITIDWKKNLVEVYKLSIGKDSSIARCRNDFFSTDYIRVKGFRLLPFVLRKHIGFNEIEIRAPHVILVRNSKAKDPAKKPEEVTIKIGDLKLPGLHIEYYDSTSCKQLTNYVSNFQIEDLVFNINDDGKQFFDLSMLHIDSTTADLPEDFYTFKVRDIKLDLPKGTFNLDTLKIIPHYDKITFGKKHGFEIDRIEGVVPYLNFSGISIYQGDTLGLRFSEASIQMFLKIFRDKRLPFKDKTTVLPIDDLKRLPVGIQIPKFVIHKSYIEYEEFADGANAAGIVFFDDLYATITNIDNSPATAKDSQMQLIAKSAFMGQGRLNVKATFPWNGDKKYAIHGSLEKFDLPRLNSVLEPTGQIRVESGHLNNLGFNFTYDSRQSSGSIQLNYEKLKLITFKEAENKPGKKQRKRNKQGDEEIKKDALKTFIVNAFIIRKNMNDKVAEDKRTGTVDFQRDTSKSIFNYWWKSLFSGIKSAYKLDKLNDSTVKKMLDKKNKD